MQLRNYMPKTLFARMLAIILVPMLLVQCITVLIFYERHWDSVTRHMAYSLSGEISYIVSQAGSTPTMEDLPALQMLAGRYFGFSVLLLQTQFYHLRTQILTAHSMLISRYQKP